jgi:hypothetical protein
VTRCLEQVALVIFIIVIEFFVSTAITTIAQAAGCEIIGVGLVRINRAVGVPCGRATPFFAVTGNGSIKVE